MGTQPTSPATRRTRQAILSAAITAWVHNRDATLADIATAAETHRATLHRHFPARADLHEAAISLCVDEITTATTSAAIEDGSPRDALRLLIANYLSVGHNIRFLFEDTSLAAHPAVAALVSTEGPVIDLIRRGQESGDFDDHLPPAWVERVIWALVYAASEAADDGTLAGHHALETLVQSIEHGIASKSSRRTPRQQERAAERRNR